MPDDRTWADKTVPEILAALADLAAFSAAQRRLDDQPCPACGGDRLARNFTGTGPCHAPRSHP